MYGLGIYLGDMSAKSHRYCSQPEMTRGKRTYRMIICSVLGRPYKIEGHLRTGDGMHDVSNVRDLLPEDVDGMIESCCDGKSDADASLDVPPEKCDMMYVPGLGSRHRPGYSVLNSEYIAYHPNQCLPKYEITYEI